jgi:signal transduction histidine kinase
MLARMVYMANKHSRLNRLFSGYATSLAIWNLSLFMTITGLGGEMIQLWWSRLAFSFYLTMINTFFYFTLVYPRGEKISRWFNWIFWSVTGILFYLTLTPKLIIGNIKIIDGSITGDIGPLIGFFSLYYVVGIVASLLVLGWKTIRNADDVRRRLARVLLGMTVFGVPMITTNMVLPIFFGNFSYNNLGPLFSLPMLVIIAYAILKDRFLDTTALIAKAVSYAMLLLAVVTIEAGIVWGMTRVLPQGTDMVMVAMIGSVLIVMGYPSLQRIVTRLTERIFFQGRYDTEDLLSHLTKVMASEIEIAPLSEKLMAILQKEMKLSGAKLILKQESQTYWSKWGEKDKVWLFDEIGEGEMKESMRGQNLAIVIPMYVKDEMVGVLSLGPKSSGEIYTEQDLAVLSIFATEAAVAIKNAQSYSEIQEFNRTLEKKVAERTAELKSSQERELEKATELLRLKNEFVFMASHDLATPVAAISGYMSLIRESKAKVSEELKDNLLAIGESTDRLKSLVNDLLQIARGESGTMKLLIEKVELPVLWENIERRVELLARARGVELKVTIDPQEVGVIETDGQKLMEIMENLLTNAIRYRLDQSESWIKIRAKKEGKQIRIEVEDNGFGIAASEQAKVFTKFFRSERKEVRAQPGTGLGLFVSQMLATNMGGEITFVSEEGVGSTFFVTLPITQTEKKGV